MIVTLEFPFKGTVQEWKEHLEMWESYKPVIAKMCNLTFVETEKEKEDFYKEYGRKT